MPNKALADGRAIIPRAVEGRRWARDKKAQNEIAEFCERAIRYRTSEIPPCAANLGGAANRCECLFDILSRHSIRTSSSCCNLDWNTGHDRYTCAARIRSASGCRSRFMDTYAHVDGHGFS